jgi:nicotinamidase-related amidase
MAADRRNHSTGDAILDEYRAKGLAGRVGYGRRPAVIVVDFIVGFTDESSPLASDLTTQVTATSRLLTTARDRSVPVFFTTTAYDAEMSEAGLFALKVPSLRTLIRGSRWVEIDPLLNRQPSERLIEKCFASAFFDTSLADDLHAAGIDTLIVTGCTTSGCIRATVVDALQHGFRAIVPKECVGDRSPEQHAANIVDIDGKYGDVVSMNDVIDYFDSLAGTP